MATTARELINPAAEIAGILASGETLSGNDVNSALKTLIRLCDRWNIDGLLQHELKPDSISLSAGSSTFNVGKDHPIISKVTFIDPYGYERPLDIYTVEQWANLLNKSLQAPFPKCVFFNNQDDSTAEFNIWPIPSVDITVRVWRRAGFTTASDLDSSIDIPYSVIDALVHDLACMLCIAFGRPISQDLRDARDQMKADVKRSNIKTPKMLNDFQGNGNPAVDPYAIYSGGEN